VRDYGLQKAGDEEIFERAKNEDCIIVSADTDFATLVALRAETRPFLILFQQVRNRRPEQQARVLLANLPAIEEPVQRGCVVVLRTRAFGSAAYRWAVRSKISRLAAKAGHGGTAKFPKGAPSAQTNLLSGKSALTLFLSGIENFDWGVSGGGSFRPYGQHTCEERKDRKDRNDVPGSAFHGNFLCAQIG
jgi:predicted nuclease of predicted toxin-antitoxin system